MCICQILFVLRYVMLPALISRKQNYIPRATCKLCRSRLGLLTEGAASERVGTRKDPARDSKTNDDLYDTGDEPHVNLQKVVPRWQRRIARVVLQRLDFAVH